MCLGSDAAKLCLSLLPLEVSVSLPLSPPTQGLWKVRNVFFEDLGSSEDARLS